MVLLQPMSLAIGLILLAGLALAAGQSRREGDTAAAGRLLGAMPWLVAPWLLAGLVTAPWAAWLAAGLLALVVVLGAAVLLPAGNPRAAADPVPAVRLDERDTMFSRAELDPGSERFLSHYERRPEHRAPDDHWRTRPGLLAAGSHQYHPLQFEAAEASFTTVAALHPLVEGEPAPETLDLDPAAATAFLKGWGRKLGALEVGITRLAPHHLYSVSGRGDRYDRPVALDHSWAIALTVEMDKQALDHAPAGPVVMESAQQYLASGTIAVQLALLIRRLGWRARAHIDGNYLLCCPLVARDAGLGEIGRMGLLMTPRLGPRVRVAVVTCDLPLIADPRRPDPTVQDFCLVCEKCAEVCPGQAIPRGEPPTVDGIRRWRIDQAACFGVWCETGTDCGRCVAVCPYSHPDTWLHRPVRWAIRRSRAARWLALRADHLLYGRRPASRTPADWWIGC
jgi:ferredoxin